MKEDEFDRAWLAYLKLIHEDCERIAKALDQIAKETNSIRNNGIIAYPRP